MKLRYSLIIFLFALIAEAQPSSYKKFWRKMGKVPSNIDECMVALDKIFDKSTKTQCANINGEDSLVAFNYKFSMEFQHRWELSTTASPITRYFVFHHVSNPPDITKIIFNSYHRKLTNQPVDFYDQLHDYYLNVLKINPPPALPVERFKIGDILKKSNKHYLLLAIVEAKDTTTNKLKIHILHITKGDQQNEKEIVSCKFGNDLYINGSSIWEDATWWRKKGESLAIDTY